MRLHWKAKVQGFSLCQFLTSLFLTLHGHQSSFLEVSSIHALTGSQEARPVHGIAAGRSPHPHSWRKGLGSCHLLQGSLFTWLCFCYWPASPGHGLPAVPSTVRPSPVMTGCKSGPVGQPAHSGWKQRVTQGMHRFGSVQVIIAHS